MTCPKCGNEQHLSGVCTRCGAAMDDGSTPGPGLLPPLGTGEILGKAFSLYLKDLPLYLILTLVGLSPLLLWALLRFKVWDTPLFGTTTALDILGNLLRLLCVSLTTAFVSRGVLRRLQGEEASLGDCLRNGFGSLFPVLGVGLLQACAILGGLFLCLFPSLYFMAMYSLAVPAVLVERAGPVSAMTRSAHLTSGYRWSLLGVLVTVILIQGGLDLALELVWAEPPQGGWNRPSPDTVSIYRLVEDLLGLFPMGLFAIANVVAYHRLRGIKGPAEESFGAKVSPVWG